MKKQRRSAKTIALLIVACTLLFGTIVIGTLVSRNKQSSMKTPKATPLPTGALIPFNAVSEKSGTYDWNDVLSQLAKELPPLTKDQDPEIAAGAKQLLSRLPGFETSFANATVTDVSGLQLDIILNIHTPADPSGNPELIGPGKESTEQVLTILEKNQYNLVASEMEYPNDMTIDRLPAYVTMTAATEGLTVTREQALKHIETQWTPIWDVWYLRAHRDRFVAGVEDIPMKGFGNKVLHALETSTGPTPRALNCKDTIESLMVLRSQVDIVNILKRMKSQNLSSAVLVIGVLHGDELTAILRSLGIHSRIYLTVPLQLAPNMTGKSK